MTVEEIIPTPLPPDISQQSWEIGACRVGKYSNNMAKTCAYLIAITSVRLARIIPTSKEYDPS